MASCDIHTHARRVMLVLALAITLAGVPRVHAPRRTSTPSRTTTGAIWLSQSGEAPFSVDTDLGGHGLVLPPITVYTAVEDYNTTTAGSACSESVHVDYLSLDDNIFDSTPTTIRLPGPLTPVRWPPRRVSHAPRSVPSVPRLLDAPPP